MIDDIRCETNTGAAVREYGQQAYVLRTNDK